MAKKRTQAVAGIRSEQDGRTKRKAAQDAALKTKQLVEDEYEGSDSDIDGEVLASYLVPSTSKKMKVVRDRVEDMPLVAPGLRLWKGFAKTVPGTDLAALTKTDVTFEQSQKYGFTLQPIIVTEGPLAGKKVLVLQENTAFRFMDLPPEIRNIVYRHLLEEDVEVQIRSYQPRGHERRPVQLSFSPGTYSRRRDQTWDAANGRWLGLGESGHSLLAVSKQMLQETATIAYGSNRFGFRKYSDARLFLDRIGSMRRFLREIELPDQIRSVSTTQLFFKQLRDATNLQSIIVRHRDVCNKDRYSPSSSRNPKILAATMKPLLKALQKCDRALEARGKTPERDLLSLVEVEHEDGHLCYQCEAKNYDLCYSFNRCSVKCVDLKEHLEELQGELDDALEDVLKS